MERNDDPGYCSSDGEEKETGAWCICFRSAVGHPSLFFKVRKG
jgi:hypothetical protein